MVMRALGVCLLILSLIGCGSGYQIGGPGGPVVKLVVSGPTSVPTYVCVKYTVSAQKDDGTPYTSTETITATLAGLGSGNTYLTLAACQNGTATTSVVIPAGTSSLDFYFRSSVAEALTITATAAGLPQGSFALTTYLFEVLGQSSGSSVRQFEEGQSFPRGVAAVNTAAGKRLFVADLNANRVTTHSATGREDRFIGWSPALFSLFWRILSLLGSLGCSRSADEVALERAEGDVAPSHPSDVASDGTRLAVADLYNNRVLIYKSIPTAFQDPDLVLGQADFKTKASNSGGQSKSSLSSPAAVATNGTALAIADGGNHRVVLHSSWPTTNNQAASVIVGQSDPAVSAPGTTKSVMKSPQGVALTASELYVADTGNNRVLYFSKLPVADGADATEVYGQADFTSSGAGTSKNTFNQPTRVALTPDNSTLVVSDSFNNRVLTFPAPPGKSQEDAKLVLGQADFDSGGAIDPPTSKSFRSPSGLSTFDGGLIVADASNSRTMIFNTFPTAANADASSVLGQETFTVRGQYKIAPSSKVFSPADVHSDGTRFFIADAANNRVLIYKSLPTANTQGADVVVGQEDFSTATQGTSDAKLASPTSVFSDGTRLFVSDQTNSRVLIYNSIPTANGAKADVVVGQPDFTTTKGATAQDRLNAPQGLVVTNSKLVVADRFNSRVLIWNTIPTANSAKADLVLGQNGDFGTNASATTQAGMAFPRDVFSDGTRLYVADSNNNRVLVWETFPTASTDLPTAVLGQPNFTTNVNNNTTAREEAEATLAGVLAWPAGLLRAFRVAANPPSAKNLHLPYALAGDATHLIIGDYSNSRLVIHTPLPTSTYRAADFQIGQANFTSKADLATEVKASVPRSIEGIYTDGLRIFYADTLQHRVGIVPMP